MIYGGNMTVYSACEKDIDFVLKKFNDSFHVALQCSDLTVDEEDYLNTLLKLIVVSIGKGNISEYISYIYREIINNAKKANMKRIYFDGKDLDINSIADYEKGMSGFKEALLDRSDFFTNLLAENKKYIRTSIKLENDVLKIITENNSPMTLFEKSVVEEKIKNAAAFNSIEDAVTTVTNNKEGAGLGLIISVLMLKKLNLSENNLRIDSNTDRTVSELMIPISIATNDDRTYIKDTILSEIKDIPQFPEHIVQIQDMLRDPDVDIKKLSSVIVKNAALTGNIIKFSNSPLYPNYKEISTITDAVKVLGLTGIKSIIYSYGSEVVLKNRYKSDKLQEIFEHSNEVALVAFQLGKKKLHRNLLESLYIAALLHDLGKILSSVIEEKMVATINQVCHERGISLSVIEELTDGLNHRVIGGELARKWNFPDSIVDVIINHHTPNYAKPENKPIVYYVYFANIIVICKNDINCIMSMLSEDAKNYFKINDKLDLEDIIAGIS